MNLHVNALEAVWVGLNLVTLVLTIVALLDAWADRAAVKLLNGHAREVVAGGIVRRESFRVIVQALLLAAVVPLITIPGDADVNVSVVALMAVPMVLLLNSLIDASDRRTTTLMVAADLLAERAVAMAETIEHTAVQVDDIHQATVEGK